MVEVLVQQLQSSVSLLIVLNIMAHAVAALGRNEEKYLFASSYIVGQLGDIGEGWDGHDCGSEVRDDAKIWVRWSCGTRSCSIAVSTEITSSRGQ